MTEVLRSPSHFDSSSPRNSYPSPSSSPSSSSSSLPAFTNLPDVVGGEDFNVSDWDTEEEEEVNGDKNKRERRRSDQLSLLAFLVTLFRKSLISSCSSDRRELCSMEIGWPTNVRHVAHVTFDRFNGFLGLPVEFEPEVPRRVPSASTTVFGVSTESMQLSYDSRGNSVPTILLLMQQRLYAEGGLQAEGIFRINAENSQEEYVRDQLNTGVVPEGVDVHCLAGLIKTWFRELPTGILDSLSPEQVMQCETEEEYLVLVRLLPQTEAALLDWAINLMADVVQNEHLNKMNERNIAMVFAPNMTQMADPLTALMYAVQVMNFLKTLILRTLRARVDLVVNPALPDLEPSDKNGHPSPSCPHLEIVAQGDNEEEDDAEPEFTIQEQPVTEEEAYFTSLRHGDDSSGETSVLESDDDDELDSGYEAEDGKSGKSCRSSKADLENSLCEKPSLQMLGASEVGPFEKGNHKGISSNLSRIDSRNEWIEAWR